MTPGAIIDDLGGASAISAKLGLPANTVSNWKVRGSIPVRYWQGLAMMGRELGRDDVLDGLVTAHVGAPTGWAWFRSAPPRAWHPPAQVDVRALRIRLGLSQPAFASRFGFSVRAVRDWEQGRRQPDPAARTLLVVIEHNPEAVTQALDAAGPVAA